MGTKSNAEWTDLRPYNESHPWLAFGFNVRCLHSDLLVQLGAISSRLRVLESVYLPPRFADKLLNVYLAKGVHGTTAIEGNALTEEEVRARVEGKKNLPKSLKYQQQEVDNIIAACNKIASETVLGEASTELSLKRISEFNFAVLRGLPVDERVVAGRVRKYQVGVSDYTAPRWDYCEELLVRLCDWLNSQHTLDREKHAIANAIIRAILCHVYIAWIHPFGDGNGRTARLLEFDILLAAGVPTIAAHLLSNHYNKTRTEYLLQLSNASKNGGHLEPFIAYALQGLQDGLNEQYELIEQYQRKITWRDYVYKSFSNDSGEPARRQRQLILELGEKHESLPINKKMLLKLSPEIAALYASKTPKTLSRDLNILEGKGLLTTGRVHVAAATWKLNAFKPKSRPPQSKKAKTAKALE